MVSSVTAVGLTVAGGAEPGMILLRSGSCWMPGRMYVKTRNPKVA